VRSLGKFLLSSLLQREGLKLIGKNGIYSPLWQKRGKDKFRNGNPSLWKREVGRDFIILSFWY
jgi:hypothetical protein